MKHFLLLTALSLSISGCSSIPAMELMLENRVACSVAKDESYVVSKYGRIGISSVISSKDTAVICDNSLPPPVNPVTTVK